VGAVFPKQERATTDESYNSSTLLLSGSCK